MRRKIAFGLTIVITVLLMVLRLGIVPGWNDVQIGPLNADYLLIVLVALTTLAIVLLCVSRTETVRYPTGAWASVGGWLSTFTGAVLALSALLDTFSWVMYGQVPPPNNTILNATDLITLICTLIFGITGGVFLAWQGFCWMARDNGRQKLRSWLALAPVLWIWFRLARYEVSYASTIDIGENFFDFAAMIFTLLFLLELARMISRVGKPPRSGLLIFSLCAAMIALSGAPATIAGIADGEALGKLLIAIVDTVFGLLALYVAVLQVFAKPNKPEKLPVEEPAEDTDEPEEPSDLNVHPTDDGFLPYDDLSDALLSEGSGDSMAWTEQPPEQPPLKPPFHIDEVLPPIPDTAIPAAPAAPAAPVSGEALTVDDLLNAIETEQNTLNGSEE